MHPLCLGLLVLFFRHKERAGGDGYLNLGGGPLRARYRVLPRDGSVRTTKL